MTAEEFLATMMRVVAPSGSEISEINDERGKLYSVKVKIEDAGKVIGKSGKHIEAIRTLFRIAAHNHGIHAAIRFEIPQRVATESGTTGVLPSK